MFAGLTSPHSHKYVQAEHYDMRVPLLLLIFSVLPTSADFSNLYTAVTDVTDVHVRPIDYTINLTERVRVELWLESDVDLTPDSLGVENGSCLLYINMTTSTALELMEPSCVLESDNASVFDQGVFDLGLYLLNLTLGVNEYSFPYYPVGFVQITTYSPVLTLGTRYNLTVFSDGTNVTSTADPVPDDYGSARSSGLVHTRVLEDRGLEYSQNPGVLVYFNASKNELNTGSTFSYNFPSTCTSKFRATAKFGGLTDVIAPHPCGDAVTGKSFPAETLVRVNLTYFIAFYFLPLASMTNGTITLWLSSGQPVTNTFRTYIIFEDGQIRVTYDELPEFWDSYPVVSTYSFGYFIESEAVFAPTITAALVLVAVIGRKLRGVVGLRSLRV